MLPGASDLNGHKSDRSDQSDAPEAGQLFARVTIREITHPPISAGPHDNLDDFAAF
jgi:hypothetical protein